MFRKLSKVFRHFVFGSFHKKRLYLEALKWSIIVRFSMVFLPFKYYRGLFGQSQTESNMSINEQQFEDALEIANTVLSVCRNTPWESLCLVEALSCKKMLDRRGFKTTLYLGVCKDTNNKELAAHAWLKMGNFILTGSHGHRSFKIVNFYS